MTELLMPDHTNFFGRALGGTVLHWMDICGAIAAMRFANAQCVTASMDHVDFIAPIELGEVVVVQSYAFDTGRTSIDVKVDVMAEQPRSGDSRETTSSFLTFVAVDEDGTPIEVPELVCETDAERQHRAAAREERREEMEALVERLDDYSQ
jgi:acyl-CoA hydrolase